MDRQNKKSLWLAIIFWCASNLTGMLYLARPIRAILYFCLEVITLLVPLLFMDLEDTWFVYLFPYGFFLIRIIGLIEIVMLYDQCETNPWYADGRGLPVVLCLFFLSLFATRYFYIEPIRIPGRSMEPTLLSGDFIVMKKLQAGTQLPAFQQSPHNALNIYRGQIIVFKYPKNPQQLYIKRVIAIPGDHLFYSNDKLIINGRIIEQKKVLEGSSEKSGKFVSHVYEENLYVFPYRIQNHNKGKGGPNWKLTIPDNMYFVMGDNRSNSHDSRNWGLVPVDHVVGTPNKIFWSKDPKGIRWKRLGLSIASPFQK